MARAIRERGRSGTRSELREVAHDARSARASRRRCSRGARSTRCASIRTGTEDQAILTFNAATRSSRRRSSAAAELARRLTPPQLHDISRARRALGDALAVPDARAGPQRRACASTPSSSRTCSQRETFFRELAGDRPAHAALEQEYERRRQDAVEAARARPTTRRSRRCTARRAGTSSTPSSRSRCRARSARARATDGADAISIPLLREQIDACPAVLGKAIEEMLRIVDGTRVVRVDVASYFAGGIETEEQLEAALDGSARASAWSSSPPARRS